LSSPPGTVVYDLGSDPTCTIGQELSQGSAGPQVQCLQERLNEITVGGTPLPEDGVYGEQTEAAVRAFQDANDLTPDGVVGPTTGGALGIWPE
jgi:peptidoglycan hydrolase-like protein with peptidoglycan-binding domain